MQFFSKPSIDFISKRKGAQVLSAVLILAGLISIGIHKGFNTSIDFAGGTLVEVGFEPAVPLEEVRSVIQSEGFSGAEITNFGDKEVLVKVKGVETAGADTLTADAVSIMILETLQNAFEDRTDSIDVRRVESVGPKIGSELKTAAFWAIIYSLAGIVFYITWRFEFRFAVAAIIALIHDVLFTLGFFSITDKEISIPVIAAILTIVGYSLNDTIVVFDRIRENFRSRKRDGYVAVVNASINETLSRTVITSLTTMMVVLSLVILGGPVIRDFALTLLIGVIIGTYSSIFIASPVLVEWEAWRSKRRKNKSKR